MPRILLLILKEALAFRTKLNKKQAISLLFINVFLD